MEIRLANREDIPRVMKFLKENWSEKHILANNREFMEYQHTGFNGEFCYIIAEEEGKIFGVEGFIPMNNAETPDIAGALWKVIPSNYFMLGKAIREKLLEITNCRYMCSPGINMNTSGRVLGRYGQKIEKMQQYYRIRDLKEYKVAKISKKIIFGEGCKTGAKLEHIVGEETFKAYLDEDVLKTKVPYKDTTHLIHRYLKHPVYKYDIYAIINGKKQNSMIVTREVKVNGTKICKVIDYLGEDKDLIGLASAWDKLMEEKEYEYIDFYCYGIDENIMQSSGFVKREDDDVNIIPNYFEPFVQENVDIYFVTNTLDKLHLYRGDGDQDRPNFY